MSFITILLIAIGLSMDSLAVSISGGICMKPFCIKKSLKMALTMGIFQACNIEFLSNFFKSSWMSVS